MQITTKHNKLKIHWFDNFVKMILHIYSKKPVPVFNIRFRQMLPEIFLNHYF